MRVRVGVSLGTTVLVALAALAFMVGSRGGQAGPTLPPASRQSSPTTSPSLTARSSAPPSPAGTPNRSGPADGGGEPNQPSGGPPQWSAREPALSTSPTSPPGLPLRATFYYPWFPETWHGTAPDPFTHYHPSLGFYDASSVVIRQQIAAMQYGNIQVGIASWWGRGSGTDGRIPALLASTAGTGFRWTVYYEPEGQVDPSVSQLSADLTYLKIQYGGDPSYLRLNGRFVVFVYAQPTDGCAMADRWKQANTVGAYIVLKVFAGYNNCASESVGWHQYAPAAAEDSQAGYSFSISPGFFKANESAPRLARDPTRWNQGVRDMVASGAPFQLVTTFNEWGEGTSVESAHEWATPSGYGAYLDVLHLYK